jgi:ankyrin repeat protein
VTRPDTIERFVNAVRSDDAPAVGELLATDTGLAKLRWPGRTGDGKMRSLGLRPFNQHTWHEVPADSNPADPRYTSTPLIYSRNDEIVRLLVEAGADVNARGTSGEVELPDWFYTPLWRAAHDGRMASVRLLVERGADVNYISPDGSNQALKTAAENDRQDVCAYLLEHGATPDLITAAMLGLSDRVESILSSRLAAIHDRDSHGRSALDAATLADSFRVVRGSFHAGHDRAAEILIQHGAEMNLAHAAALGRLDDVKRMVERDPDVARRPLELSALIGGTATPESPLSAARRRGHRNVEAYLRDQGATEKQTVVIR